MTNQATGIEEETRRLVVAITDFLRDQLIVRTDLVPEDTDCLEIAIQCLEMAYGLEGDGYLQYRFSRPLLDIFNQVTNPVSVKDKLRADAHKEEGNAYMRRNMFANAETEYANAIELDKWNAVYYCNRASSRIEQRHYFEAIADCRQALLLNPDYAKAHARMGQAYALIHRPREAARCFRQALELEPDNERYRNNLSVAESEINRADPMELINALIGSLFNLPSGNDTESSSTIRLPTSFMIITESHPPTQERPTTESMEAVAGSEESQTSENAQRASSISEIMFNIPFGVIDEGSEEQPIPQIEVTRQPYSTDENTKISDGGSLVRCPCDDFTDNVEQSTDRQLVASLEKLRMQGENDMQNNEARDSETYRHLSDIKRKENLNNKVTSSKVETDSSPPIETDEGKTESKTKDKVVEDNEKMNENSLFGSATMQDSNKNAEHDEKNLVTNIFNNQVTSSKVETDSSPSIETDEGKTEPKTKDKVVEDNEKMNENRLFGSTTMQDSNKNAEHDEKNQVTNIFNNQVTSSKVETDSSPLSETDKNGGKLERKTDDKVVENIDEMIETGLPLKSKTMQDSNKNIKHDDKNQSANESKSSRNSNSTTLNQQGNEEENVDAGESSKRKTTEDLD